MEYRELNFTSFKKVCKHSDSFLGSPICGFGIQGDDNEAWAATQPWYGEKCKAKICPLWRRYKIARPKTRPKTRPKSGEKSLPDYSHIGKIIKEGPLKRAKKKHGIEMR